MAKKETKPNKLEREYIIPLRKEWRKVPRYKRANKAVRAIKEFLVRHMKVREGDLKKIKINTALNEIIWLRGIKKPLARVKVKAVKDGENVIVTPVDVPEKIKFKEAKREGREKKAMEAIESKKSLMQKAKEGISGTPTTPQTEGASASTQSAEQEQIGEREQKEGKKAEEKEKKAAVVEAGEKMEKEAAKKTKHQVKREKITKRQIRKTLAK